MEKLRKTILKLCIIFLVFSVVFNINFCAMATENYIAHTEDDYSIKLPYIYNKMEDGSYSDNIHIVNAVKINVMSQYDIDELDETLDYEEVFYTMDQLENMTSAMFQQIEDTNNPIKVYSEDIVNYSKNNYKGFKVTGYIPYPNVNYYFHMYITMTSGDAIYFLVYSPYEEYFDSKEFNSILDSYTIKNYVHVIGQDRMTEISYLAILTVGIGVLAYIMLFIKALKTGKKDGQIITSIVLVIIQAFGTISNWREVILIKYFDEYTYLLGYFWLLWLAIILLNSSISENKVKKKNKINNEDVEIKSDSKYCTNCGKEINNTWEFCINCGKKLK